MKIFWDNKYKEIISQRKLKEVTLDIEAIKNGNYILNDLDED